MTQAQRKPSTIVPLPMLEMIPSGYYAVRPDTETPYRFMRLARPNFGKQKGLVKVQTQHSERLEDRWFWNPTTGQTWNFDRTIEEYILLLIVDHRKWARAWAGEVGTCHRCNKTLTDERSRWYGFGPECEGSLEGEKDEIDDENEGTYEYLSATQDPVYTEWLERQHPVQKR